MSDLRVSVAFGKVPEAFRHQPASVSRLVTRIVLDEGSAYLAGRLALATPVGATGKARQAVTHETELFAGGGEGHVDYAEPIGSYIVFADQGTRPHWPPYEPIALWTLRVLGIHNPKVVGAIRAKIARVGTKAQHFVEDTATTEGPYAVQIMGAAAERAVRQINQGPFP